MPDFGKNNSRLDKLREKPKDQKTAIAGGVAITVVAILLAGWAIWFFKKIASEKPPTNVYDADFAYIRNEIGGSANTTFGGGGDAFFDSAEDYQIKDQSYDSFDTGVSY